MANATTAALQFVGVSLVYGFGGTAALRDVAFTLRPGEWAAVMGANGSGKSTLARLAAGVLLPSAGSVRVYGCATDAPGFGALRPRLGYLSQHPEDHVVGLTVRDDVGFGLARLGWPQDAAARRVRECLAAVGMAGTEERHTYELSGGELQRVALAGVLAPRPQLLILDEPTAYADPQVRRLVLRVVRTYARSTGAAVLWVTHDTEEAAAADRVLVLQGGRLVFDGPPAALWERRADLWRWGVGPGPGADGDERADGTGAAPEGAGRALLGFRPEPLAAARRLHFAYRGQGGPVLRDAAMEVRAGGRVALVGPSGAGKSTLLQVLALLEMPASGELVLLGEQVPTGTGRGARRRWRAAARRLQPRLGLAMQQAEVQLFGRTVREDMVFGLRHLGVPPEEWEERIRDALERVGLPPEYLARPPGTLSGGERRRVALALCLAQRPALYLFDEPSAGLDYPGRLLVARTINELAREPGVGVVFATHDPELVARCATSVVALRDGTTVLMGKACADRFWQYLEPARGAAADAATGPAGAGAAEGAITEPARPSWRSRPEAHLLGAALVALAIAAVRSWAGLAAGGLLAAALLRRARVPLKSLLTVAAALLPFAAAAGYFAGKGPPSAADAVGARAAAGAFVGLRMLFAVASVWWVSRALSLPQLFAGLQGLFGPLRRIGVPSDVLTAATLVAIRMVPVLSEEAQRIYRAQGMRGLAGVRGLRGAWLRLSSLAVPLFGAALRRAEHLSVALLTRGYGEGAPAHGPTGLKPREWAALGALGLAALLVTVCDRLGG